MIPLASLASALLIILLGGLCFFHVRYPPLVSHKGATEEKKCYNEAMLEQIDGLPSFLFT
jgi:hypothetical protein